MNIIQCRREIAHSRYLFVNYSAAERTNEEAAQQVCLLIMANPDSGYRLRHMDQWYRENLQFCSKIKIEKQLKRELSRRIRSYKAVRSM